MKHRVAALALTLFALTACGQATTATDNVRPGPAVGTPEPAPVSVPRKPEPGSLPAYTESDYTYMLEIGCFCAINGKYKITVEDGEATDAVLVKSFSGWPEGQELPPYVKQSIQDIIDAANEVGEDGDLTVRWPEGQAYPSSVAIDPFLNAVDEESYYQISQVQVS